MSAPKPFGTHVCAVLCLFFLSPALHAANLNVQCGKKGVLNSINAAIGRLAPQGPNTIQVSGTCQENVVIEHFDRLTLLAAPGTEIVDASSGASPVLTIRDSQRIEINGFTITGGAPTVVCSENSYCRFISDTIQNSGREGVFLDRSTADFAGGTIQNNHFTGLNAGLGSRVDVHDLTVQGNSEGITVQNGGFANVHDNTVIQNNTASGIEVTTHGTLEIEGTIVTSNGAHGVFLKNSANARFSGEPNTITNNGISGVSVNDLSFAEFHDPNVITGNANGDVTCNPQFSATRGAFTNIGGGTTNCVEP